MDESLDKTPDRPSDASLSIPEFARQFPDFGFVGEYGQRGLVWQESHFKRSQNHGVC